MSRYLDKIDSPEDLRKLPQEALPELCAEIRSYMLDCCSRNPGHVASSLGAVELIVGLHYVYDTPSDKLVFDVGHQTYAHKILTGRREAFRTNRCKGGISGFPKITESPYDAFGVGHSSTSISAALGMAEAARIQGSASRAVAVIGDGALSGGLAFEGLNNAGAGNADILVIINDNNHSIDDNIGAMHEHLLRITTNPRYNRLKGKVWDSLGETRARSTVQRWLRGMKSYAVKSTGGDLFEAMGFRYFGPIDGNDMDQVVSTLRSLRELKGPRILHCCTVKGKGFAPAEADPTVWHAPGVFDPRTGERKRSPYPCERYQDVFGAVLREMAEKDRRIVAITPAMGSGSGLNDFATEFPDRFFDVGIAEEHAVTFAAGLAAAGMRPVCSIYSSFSQRAYDEIIHDVAMQHLPVLFCFDRAGIVGEDGATHHGAFDLTAYRPIPGMVIGVPRDETALKQMMYTYCSVDGPMIIRYPRGLGEGSPWKDAPCRELPLGRAECLEDGSRTALLCLGPVCTQAVEAAREYAGKHGYGPAVYDMRWLKPLDNRLLDMLAEEFDRVITLEDGAVHGGLFSAVAEHFASRGASARLEAAGIPDEFISQGTRTQLLADCGLDRNSILLRLENDNNNDING